MSFQKTPGGTRGGRNMPSNPVTRLISKTMTSWHKRSGDKFQGMDLLYLTTVGAKSGEKRQSTVSRFADGDDAWLIVASAAGATKNPAWYHNIAAHPDQVWVEFGGKQQRVIPAQLQGRKETRPGSASRKPSLATPDIRRRPTARSRSSS